MQGQKYFTCMNCQNDIQIKNSKSHYQSQCQEFLQLKRQSYIRKSTLKKNSSKGVDRQMQNLKLKDQAIKEQKPKIKEGQQKEKIQAKQKQSKLEEKPKEGFFSKISNAFKGKKKGEKKTQDALPVIKKTNSQNIEQQQKQKQKQKREQKQQQYWEWENLNQNNQQINNLQKQKSKNGSEIRNSKNGSQAKKNVWVQKKIPSQQKSQEIQIGQATQPSLDRKISPSFESIQCLKCHKHIPLLNIDSHQISCSYQIQCEYCYELINVLSIEQHQKQCTIKKQWERQQQGAKQYNNELQNLQNLQKINNNTNDAYSYYQQQYNHNNIHNHNHNHNFTYQSNHTHCMNPHCSNPYCLSKISQLYPHPHQHQPHQHPHQQQQQQYGLSHVYNNVDYNDNEGDQYYNDSSQQQQQQGEWQQYWQGGNQGQTNQQLIKSKHKGLNKYQLNTLPLTCYRKESKTKTKTKGKQENTQKQMNTKKQQQENVNKQQQEHKNKQQEQEQKQKKESSEKQQSNTQVEKQQEPCSICYLEFQQLQTIMKLPCNHLFHPECVGQWFENDDRCPMCKKKVA